MKLFIIVAAVLIAAGSFYADYRWRRWMAARRAPREDR
jgi:hypothetical protein